MLALFFHFSLALNDCALAATLKGNWNVTRVVLTKNGREHPDSLRYQVTLDASSDGRGLIGQLIQILPDGSEKEDRLVKFVIESDNATELLVGDMKFGLRFEQVKPNEFVAQGVNNSPRTVLSFHIFSPYSAVLDVYDAGNDQVAEYRCTKEYESTKLNSLATMLSYLVQKIIFRRI